jgi:hypothetical protein
MELKTLKQGTDSALVSRREFLTASATLIGVVALERHAIACPPSGEDGSISDDVFDHARQRASELVGRMSLEEVVGQLGNNSPALPHLGVQRYGYWNRSASWC